MKPKVMKAGGTWYVATSKQALAYESFESAIWSASRLGGEMLRRQELRRKMRAR